MKASLSIVTLIFLATASVVCPLTAAEDEGEEPPGQPRAPAQLGPLKDVPAEVLANLTVRELLANVVSRFPQDPLLITGDFMIRRRRGVVVGERKFRMTVNWGSEPSVAKYEILDKDGQPLEAMTITRKRGKTRFDYLAGNPPHKEALPNLYASIQGTDVSWMDLTFSFLWWEGGVITGMDRIRGYNCYVVEIDSPGNQRGSDGSYAKMRLWIEKKMHVLLQAEGYDPAGKAKRRLWVKSCKKINDRWMIKDMEIQSYPAVHRTKLTIREVTAATRP